MNKGLRDDLAAASVSSSGEVSKVRLERELVESQEQLALATELNTQLRQRLNEVRKELSSFICGEW